ncbi:bacteriohemerythrin [Herbaspirillum sp. RV1423]|uniref:bacteriohemerythrin n=1 Tax=Herbaspirillum sp. RV1423 TaxID=1443993 RepID=UPI0004B18FC4|nr:hemerythrin family protein [Herbaspirillum sp. RV1423]
MEELAQSSCISLGIATIDNAHKILTRELVAILNAPDHEFTRCFQRISRLLESSFREEEELMERIAYHDLRAHREQHAALLSALHHIIPKVMNGDYVLSRQILSMLPQWFLGHLVKMDAALIKALAAAGAQPIPRAYALPTQRGSHFCIDE